MINFTLVMPECGDWEALYINGKLLDEGHSLWVEGIIDMISQEYSDNFDALKDDIRLNLVNFEYKTITDEVAERGMPERLEELK